MNEGQSPLERALCALAELGHGLSSEDLGRLLVPDPYDEELAVMADVRAYFHIGYKVRRSFASQHGKQLKSASLENNR